MGFWCNYLGNIPRKSARVPIVMLIFSFLFQFMKKCKERLFISKTQLNLNLSIE